jgi:hypothetical protein
MATTTNTVPRGRQADTAPQSQVPPDWNGADYDSFEVLVTLRVADPIDRVTRARQGHCTEGTR